MNHTKQQLLQCIQDLAERCLEVNEPDLAITLFTLYAAGMTNTDKSLGYWSEAFAVAQLKQLAKPELDKEVDNQENSDKP